MKNRLHKRLSGLGSAFSQRPQPLLAHTSHSGNEATSSGELPHRGFMLLPAVHLHVVVAGALLPQPLLVRRPVRTPQIGPTQRLSVFGSLFGDASELIFARPTSVSGLAMWSLRFPAHYSWITAHSSITS